MRRDFCSPPDVRKRPLTGSRALEETQPPPITASVGSANKFPQEELRAAGVDKYLGELTPVSLEELSDGWTKHTFDPDEGDRPSCIADTDYSVFTRAGNPAKLRAFGGQTPDQIYFDQADGVWDHLRVGRSGKRCRGQHRSAQHDPNQMDKNSDSHGFLLCRRGCNSGERRLSTPFARHVNGLRDPTNVEPKVRMSGPLVGVPL